MDELSSRVKHSSQQLDSVPSSGCLRDGNKLQINLIIINSYQSSMFNGCLRESGEFIHVIKNRSPPPSISRFDGFFLEIHNGIGKGLVLEQRRFLLLMEENLESVSKATLDFDPV